MIRSNDRSVNRDKTLKLLKLPLEMACKMLPEIKEGEVRTIFAKFLKIFFYHVFLVFITFVFLNT